jgi:uncharacterized membrane protein (UPF0127 family)
LATAEARLADLPRIELAGGLIVFEARAWAARRDGLSGLDELPADWGLWIAPCRSIHTFGMRVDLDLIWLGKDDDVRAVTRRVSPRRQRSDWRARSVIEVGAGRGDVFAAAWSRNT